MVKRSSRKITSWLICMMLIVAMAFSMLGCGGKNDGENPEPTTEVQGTDDTGNKGGQDEPTTAPQGSEETKDTVLGEGQTVFAFRVVDKDGKETSFEIHTDKETVGEALLEVSLIAGETSEYGLYVKTVNGITADYDVDKTYWAFYIDGEYATTGVDSTKAEAGKTYMFKVEK